MSLFARPDRVGLLVNLATLMALAMAAGVAVQAFDLDRNPRGNATPLSPPGWVVGAVWVGLFAAMAVARWLLLRAAAGTRALDLLIALCLSYVGFAIATGSTTLAFLGNLATILLALAAARAAAATSGTAAALILPVAAWTAFATLLLAIDSGG
jgi:tryptophan-rich sensory protein